MMSDQFNTLNYLDEKKKEVSNNKIKSKTVARQNGEGKHSGPNYFLVVGWGFRFSSFLFDSVFCNLVDNFLECPLGSK